MHYSKTCKQKCIKLDSPSISYNQTLIIQKLRDLTIVQQPITTTYPQVNQTDILAYQLATCENQFCTNVLPKSCQICRMKCFLLPEFHFNHILSIADLEENLIFQNQENFILNNYQLAKYHGEVIKHNCQKLCVNSCFQNDLNLFHKFISCHHNCKNKIFQLENLISSIDCYAEFCWPEFLDSNCLADRIKCLESAKSTTLTQEFEFLDSFKSCKILRGVDTITLKSKTSSCSYKNGKQSMINYQKCKYNCDSKFTGS